MTDQEKRIKLAEAMGWTSWNARWLTPDHKTITDLPDPFTDANDDYAVLEWMREQATWVVGDVSDQFCDQLEWNCWEYQIGDYARAALKVIE